MHDSRKNRSGTCKTKLINLQKNEKNSGCFAQKNETKQKTINITNCLIKNVFKFLRQTKKKPNKTKNISWEHVSNV